jgi:phosphoglycolate phosphatase-like HAD superfamily hydrolase
MIGAVHRAVGFDLDMTLVDTRRGIELALLALAAETERPIDAAGIVASLGPPITDTLAPWFDPSELSDAVQRFRRHMAEVGVANVDRLPGASEAVEAARAAGYDVVVITAKIEPLAAATLRHAGLTADRVFGNVWAEGKAEPLRVSNAVCFVGDHPSDMVAAKAASVAAFGVTSGAATPEELLGAGADLVAPSLAEFPSWLTALTTVDAATGIGQRAARGVLG